MRKRSPNANAVTPTESPCADGGCPFHMKLFPFGILELPVNKKHVARIMTRLKSRREDTRDDYIRSVPAPPVSFYRSE